MVLEHLFEKRGLVAESFFSQFVGRRPIGWTLIVALFLQACASKDKGQSGTQLAAPAIAGIATSKAIPICPPENKDGPLIISKAQQIVKDADLYQLLAKKNLLMTAKNKYRVFDLSCETGGKDGVICWGRTWPNAGPPLKRTEGRGQVVWKGAEASDLFGLVAMLPIYKGDGGLSVDAVFCEKTPVSGKESTVICSVAMPIQYVPHSGMVPIREGE